MKHKVRCEVVDVMEGLAEHAMDRALKIYSSALSTEAMDIEARKRAFDEAMSWLYAQNAEAFELE